jgi:hypothetical protein
MNLNTHPGWCDPRSCSPTHAGITHHSDLTALPFTDATVEIQAVAADEHAYPEQGRNAEVLVAITDGPMVGQDGYMYLTLNQVRQLRDALDETYWRLTLLDAPVVHHARRVAS